MGFSLIVLLTDDNIEMSIDILASQFQAKFSRMQNFSFAFHSVPFEKENRYFIFNWDNFYSSAYFETGTEVKDDSEYIAGFANPELAKKISEVSRRIRINFGSDNDRIYTNEIILVWEIVENIDGAILFDINQNQILDRISNK